jgi:hypothetical protein
MWQQGSLALGFWTMLKLRNMADKKMETVLNGRLRTHHIAHVSSLPSWRNAMSMLSAASSARTGTSAMQIIGCAVSHRMYHSMVGTIDIAVGLLDCCGGPVDAIYHKLLYGLLVKLHTH